MPDELVPALSGALFFFHETLRFSETSNVASGPPSPMMTAESPKVCKQEPDAANPPWFSRTLGKSVVSN